MSEEKKKIIELNDEELNIVNAGKGGDECNDKCSIKNKYDICPLTHGSVRPGCLYDCATCRSYIGYLQS